MYSAWCCSAVSVVPSFERRFVTRLVVIFSYPHIPLFRTSLTLPSLTATALMLGNWRIDIRLFEYLGDVGKTAKRLLASRALAGWDKIDVQPTNPTFLLDHNFTKEVVEKMILHAYGEHLRGMGEMPFLP
jgi:hypothetical protein